MADNQVRPVAVRQTFDAVLIARRSVDIGARIVNVARQIDKFFERQGARLDEFFGRAADVDRVNVVSFQALFQVPTKVVVVDGRVEVDADLNFLDDVFVDENIAFMAAGGVGQVDLVGNMLVGIIEIGFCAR